MRTRNCYDSLFREFECRDSLVAAYGWECLKKLFERVASLEILKEILHRDASPNEHRLPAHDLRVSVYYLLSPLAHFVILPLRAPSG